MQFTRNGLIDLRSDTVTLPSAAMLRYMMQASVGDVCRGDDPSVSELEAYTADLLGFQKALFVPSGIMANQIAARIIAKKSTLLLAPNSHVQVAENNAAHELSQVRFLPIGKDGKFSFHDMVSTPDAFIKGVWVENTHTRSGGSVFPFEDLKKIFDFARQNKWHVHVDGARFFNTVVASNIPAHEWIKYCHSMSICLSKGLGAPVGSVLCGTEAFIEEAKVIQKMFGGCWRKAGHLAAAGLYALKNNRERLVEDHLHAQIFSTFLQKKSLQVLNKVETNIVHFSVPEPQRFLMKCKEHGLLFSSFEGMVRAVFHLDIGKDTVRQAIKIAEGCL